MSEYRSARLVLQDENEGLRETLRLRNAALDRVIIERDEWERIALQERAATVDLLEQIKIRDARIEAARDVAKLMSQSHMRGWVGSCGDEILEALEG